MKKIHHLIIATLTTIVIIFIIIFKLAFNTKTTNNIMPPNIINKPDEINKKETALEQFFNKLINNLEEWNNYQEVINDQSWNIAELDIEDQERWNKNLETLKIMIIELINNFLVRKEK